MGGIIMQNLDFLCMQTAQNMVGDSGNKTEKENLATKGLGVLLENGPYGLILYLKTSEKENIARDYVKKLFELSPVNGCEEGKEFEKLKELSKDLDKYLFLKKLWQQTLTYARYHAKALPDDTKDNISGEPE
jgi:hypothetical protein